MTAMQLNYIANASVPSASGRTIAMIDPSDGQPFDEIQRSNADDIDAAVHAARQCYNAVWQKLAPVERGRLLQKLSAKILEHADELTALEQRDCGKPTKQARADAIALARYFEFYAGACDKFHGETIPYPDGYSVLTWREPHGVTGHVIPWNYPMQIFGRSVGGALAAGNVCVVKPAEDACLSLIRVAQLAAEVGFPSGALNIVTGYGHQVGAERHCPVTLELGGKSPQIIFADADLDAAIPVVINAIVQNAGQTCSAGSRVLIDSLIYEPQLERVWDFLSDAQVAGIPMVAQGVVVDEAPETGYYQAPTLLRDVPVGHRLAQEEVFGPVLSAMAFQDEDHAVELANATQFGLVAGIWTRDGARQFRMAKRVHSGQVFINNYGAAGGVELPFGGVKSSGYGREKGFEALYGFTTLKTVAIKYG